MQLNPERCALENYAIPCSGHMTGGHILNRSKCGGNKKAIAILKTCPPEIMTVQCYQHNISRFADTSEAVKIMLLQKIYEHGFLHMSDWFGTFLSTFKVWPTDLELERLIS